MNPMERKDAELLILKKELLLKDEELKTLYKEIQELKDIQLLKDSIHSTKYTQRNIDFEKVLLHKDKELQIMDEKMYDLRMQLEAFTKTIAPAPTTE
jgi:hypothetical protein